MELPLTLVTKAYAELIAKERGAAIDQIVKLSFPAVETTKSAEPPKEQAAPSSKQSQAAE